MDEYVYRISRKEPKILVFSISKTTAMLSIVNSPRKHTSTRSAALCHLQLLLSLCSRATTAREDRHLSLLARRYRGATASQISRELYAVTEKRVSRVIVSKRLNERGLFSRSFKYIQLTIINLFIILTSINTHWIFYLKKILQIKFQHLTSH